MTCFRVLTCLFLIVLQVHADQTVAYQEGAQQAREMNREKLDGTHLLEENASRHIPHFKSVKEEEEQTYTSHDYQAMMKDIVKVQLASDRPRIDPNTDPIFVNANRAIANPEETLKKQTVSYVDDKDYEERACIDTRDEEFEVINTARIDPYYKRYEVWQFYNHCPNHRGWGKSIAQGCVTWQNRHNMRVTHNPDADYEEIHGMAWVGDKHPEFDFLISTGKCRLKKEMAKEEGRQSRMIPVEFYKKAETYDTDDCEITKIDEHREGRSRLKRPEDFGVDSFVKIQVFICSYKTPGNTCSFLRSKGGIEQKSTCSERVGDVCVKWRKKYKVPKAGAVKRIKTTDLSEGHVDPFNLDGRMDDKSYVENREAPEAIAKLTALHKVGSALPKIDTGDPNSLSVFNGVANRCVAQAGNNRCPGGNGTKTAGDLALEKKWNEGKCIRVDSYEEQNKNIGQMVGQKRTVTTYCCFETILAKVLHQGAIDQGINSFGDPKTTNCNALTLGQLQRMNWDRVDFGPFVAEMTSRVNMSTAHVANKSSVTVRSHLSNQMTAAQSERMREQARSARNGGGSS